MKLTLLLIPAMLMGQTVSIETSQEYTAAVIAYAQATEAKIAASEAAKKAEADANAAIAKVNAIAAKANADCGKDGKGKVFDGSKLSQGIMACMDAPKEAKK